MEPVSFYPSLVRKGRDYTGVMSCGASDSITSNTVDITLFAPGRAAPLKTDSKYLLFSYVSPGYARGPMRVVVLTVENVDTSDSGIYKCVANNRFGSNITAFALLVVEGQFISLIT